MSQAESVPECCPMSWLTAVPLWITIGTAISAGGKFLDTHVGPRANSHLRSTLIKLFLLIDRAMVPNLPEMFWRWLNRSMLRIGRFRVPLLLAALYWLITSSFYVSRTLSGDQPDMPYFKYVLYWIDQSVWFFYWTLSALGVFASLALSSIVIARFSRSKSLLMKAVWIVSGGLLSMAMLTLTGFIIVMLLGGYAIGVALRAGLLSSAPLGFVVIVLLVSLCATALLRCLRWIFSHMLDAASSPATTPFLYASTFFGFATSMFGILKELLAWAATKIS